MSDDHSRAIASTDIDIEIVEVDPIASSAMEMLRANPTPDTADKILDFIERLQANKARQAYIQALVGLKRDLPPTLTKNRRNEFSKNTYATLDSIMNEIRPALTMHGFDLSWKTRTAGREMIVICRLMHAGGHYEECESPPAPPDTGKGRSQVQAIGSTMTYLARYSLKLMLGLAETDAPDADDQKDQRPTDARDIKKALRYRSKLERDGLDLDAACELVGRPPKEWTLEDCDLIADWARKEKEKRKDLGIHAEEPPEEWKGNGELFDNQRNPEGDL